METIALEYDVRNKQAQDMIEIMFSSGSTNKKSGIDRALEDIKMGRLSTVHISKNKNQ